MLIFIINNNVPGTILDYFSYSRRGKTEKKKICPFMEVVFIGGSRLYVTEEIIMKHRERDYKEKRGIV